MYQVTVEGQYYKSTERGKTLARYKEKFVLPELDLALSIIQNQLINDRLLDKDPNACSFRTCAMVDYKAMDEEDNESKEVPISRKSKRQIQEYILKENLLEHIDPSQLGGVKEAREKLQDVVDNLEYLEEQKESKEKESRDKQELLKLNKIGEYADDEIKDLSEGE